MRAPLRANDTTHSKLKKDDLGQHRYQSKVEIVIQGKFGELRLHFHSERLETVPQAALVHPGIVYASRRARSHLASWTTV